MKPVLSCKDLAFDYGGPKVLESIDLEVRPGEMMAVVGRNGSGKSTLLRLLSGLLSPTSGSVRVLGEDTRGLDPVQVARKVAYVPQEFFLSLPFTVRELVLTGRHPHLRPLQFEGPEDLEAVESAMEKMGVLDLADRPFSELSGGERQRVLVATALAQQTRVLVLDEPSSSLDIHFQDQLMRLLNGLREEREVAVVIAVHDLNLAAAWCPRLALLSGGSIEVVAGPEEVFTEERLMRAYGPGARLSRVGDRLCVLPLGPGSEPGFDGGDDSQDNDTGKEG